MALIKLIPTRAAGNATDEFVKANFAYSKETKRCNLNLTVSEAVIKFISPNLDIKKVDIFYDDQNPYFIVLKKSLESKGNYSLAKKGYAYSISFTWRFDVPQTPQERATKKVHFNLYSEGGLQIELNKEAFTPYPGG